MVSIEELKLGNETLEALKHLLLNVSELEGELKTIDMEELKQNNILIKKNLAETKETLETIKPLEQKAQNVFNELAKTQEKLTELDALRKKIENLSALGLVNDTLVDTDHTYSSSKIKKLIDSASLELKTSSDSLESKYTDLSQSISTLQSSLSGGLSNADDKFALKTDLEASKQDANNKFTLKTDFANYKDAEGYTKLPNSLIIQWGRIGIPIGGRARVTYPIVFPNARLMLFIGSLIDAASNSNGTGGYHRPGSFDNDRTGFDVVGMYGYTASYIAIGH